jgi:hypothetical protein
LDPIFRLGSNSGQKWPDSNPDSRIATGFGVESERKKSTEGIFLSERTEKS